MDDTLYDDPWYYRMLFDRRSHDLAFYLDLAKKVDGVVLELGVGTGRVALSLARAGHTILGADSSEPMLAELAEPA